MQGGLIEPKLAPFNPHHIIAAKIKNHELLLKIKQLRVQHETLGRSSSFTSDETFFSEIFEILLSNAMKYSPTGRTIVVRSRISPQEVMVEVMDEGPGISPEDQEKLFVGASDVDPGQNSHGLGLMMGEKYISLIGGTLGLRPKTKGSVFFFTIPKPVL